MEVGLNKTGFSCYDKTFSQTLRKEESQDSVVPDTMPDIGEILESSGSLMIRSKDIGEGGVRISASIAANVVYKSDGEERVCALELSVPVSVSVEDEGIRDDQECTAEINILSIDTRVLNPRKVLVRAEICAQIDCYTLGKMELCQDTDGKTEGIYVQKKNVLLTPAVSVREKTFVLTDELAIPASRASAAQILSHRVCISSDEVKPVGNKLIFKGSVKCGFLYLTADGLISEAEFESGYSQIIEIDTPCSDPVAELTLMLTGAYFELMSSGDGRSISMEVHALAQAVCCERMEASYIADAYSNTNPIELTMQEHNALCIRRQSVLRENLRQLYETPYPVTDVLGAHTVAGLAERVDDTLRVPVSVCVIYRSGDGALHSGRKKYELSFPLALDDDESASMSAVSISDLYLSPASGGIELRLHGEVSVSVFSTCRFEAVGAISCDESATLDNSKLPSLVIVRAASGDDLWALAKENCSTIDLICKVNALEELEGTWEKYLLIPKVR